MDKDPLAPFKIDPEGWYREGQLFLALEITGQAMLRARRLGKLRYAKIGNFRYMKGQWIIDWLESEGRIEEANHERDVL